MATASITSSVPPPNGPYQIPSKTRQHRRPRGRDDFDYTPPPEIRQERRVKKRYALAKKHYTSPRCMVDDQKLFPSTENLDLHSSEVRWDFISEQAGSHRQDGSVLTINRSLSPQALKAGVTQQVAARVRRLNLWLDHTEDILPEWLDIVSSLFFKLEHFTLSADDISEGDASVGLRMRRLYVLYRMPDLKSIDGITVTRVERRLARPEDPNGQRVDRKDWVPKDNMMPSEDENVAYADEVDDDTSEDDTSEDEEHDEGDNDEDDSGSLHVALDEYQDNQTRDVDNECQDHNQEEVSIKQSHEVRDRYSTENDSETDEDEGSSADADDDEQNDLVGEGIIEMSSSSGEQREDKSCHSGAFTGKENRDNAIIIENEKDKTCPSPTTENRVEHGDAVEVDLSGAVRSVRLDSHKEDKHTLAQKNRSPQETNTDERHQEVNEHQLTLHTNQCQINPCETLELLSVASSHNDWSAACGGLSFVNFKTEAFCSTSKLRISFAKKQKQKRSSRKSDRSRPKTNNKDKMLRLKEKGELTLNPCPSVQRHSTVRTPSPPGCEVVRANSSGSLVKFFPSEEHEPVVFSVSSQRPSNTTETVDTKNSSGSPNKKIPPSKSLTSPFPMQFRDRSLQIHANHNSNTEKQLRSSGAHGYKSIKTMETISSPIPLTRIASSPSRFNAPSPLASKKCKGDLPPPCPGGSRRRFLAATNTLTPRKVHSRRLKASKQSARRKSVLDLSDEDDTDDDTESSDEDEILMGRSNEDDDEVKTHISA